METGYKIVRRLGNGHRRSLFGYDGKAAPPIVWYLLGRLIKPHPGDGALFVIDTLENAEAAVRYFRDSLALTVSNVEIFEVQYEKTPPFYHQGWCGFYKNRKNGLRFYGDPIEVVEGTTYAMSLVMGKKPLSVYNALTV